MQNHIKTSCMSFSWKPITSNPNPGAPCTKGAMLASLLLLKHSKARALCIYCALCQLPKPFHHSALCTKVSSQSTLPTSSPRRAPMQTPLSPPLLSSYHTSLPQILFSSSSPSHKWKPHEIRTILQVPSTHKPNKCTNY